MESLLIYTRSVTLNLSEDIVMEWQVSDFCILIEMFLLPMQGHVALIQGQGDLFHLLGI